jgi:hypothetical protein
MADASPWEDLFVPIFPSSALLWVSDPKICAASIKPRVVRAITWPDDWRYPNPGIFQLNGFRPSSLALRRKLPPYRVAGIANRFIRVCPASPSSHIFATGIKAFSRSGRTKYFGEMLIYSSSPQKQGFSRWFFMDSRLRALLSGINSCEQSGLSLRESEALFSSSLVACNFERGTLEQ